MYMRTTTPLTLAIHPAFGDLASNLVPPQRRDSAESAREQQVPSAQGLFWGGDHGLSVGGFGSVGLFLGIPGAAEGTYPELPAPTAPCGETPEPPGAGIVGFALGAGLGAFLTNATQVSDLSGPFDTFSLNTPWFGLQFGISGDTWIFSGTKGPSYRPAFDLSRYPTNTWTVGP